MLLAGCAIEDPRAAALCGLPLPTVSEQDTDQTLIGVDNYRAKVRAICAVTN